MDQDNDNDSVYENVEDESSDAAVAKIKKLKQKLEACEKDKQEYLTGWQRAQADLINLRKKDQEKLVAAVEHANEDLILSLLPVLDGFDAAMANKESWESVPENWRKGVEYLYNELFSQLEQVGLSRIDTSTHFNPELHEAVGTEAKEGSEEGEILKVIQQGYLFHKKMLRQARVIVAE